MRGRVRSVQLLGLGIIAACAGKQEAKETKQAAAPPTPLPVVEVVAADYAFQAPDTIKAGLVTMRLRNTGKELHHVLVIRLNEGKTLKDVGEALKTSDIPPAWVVTLGGPNAPAPGGPVSQATVRLTPGSYALLCVIPSPDGTPHVAKGMAKPFVVVAGASGGRPLAPDLTVRLSDYDFEFSQPLTAGHHVIRVENTANQFHEMFLARLEPGKTALELARWAEKPEGPPPGVPFGGVTALSHDEFNVIEVNLQPGEYALICFLPDAKDGKPHLLHGMLKQLKIS